MYTRHDRHHITDKSDFFFFYKNHGSEIFFQKLALITAVRMVQVGVYAEKKSCPIGNCTLVISYRQVFLWKFFLIKHTQYSSTLAAPSSIASAVKLKSWFFCCYLLQTSGMMKKTHGEKSTKGFFPSSYDYDRLRTVLVHPMHFLSGSSLKWGISPCEDISGQRGKMLPPYQNSIRVFFFCCSSGIGANHMEKIRPCSLSNRILLIRT